MTQPFGPFQVGGTVYPLSTTAPETSLQLADPALFFMLDFYTFVIQQHVEQRMLQEAAECSAPIPKAVVQRYPATPQADHFLSNQYKFPLLAIGRTRAMTGRFTAGWEHDRTYFDLSYVLPPLSASQSERMLPFLPAVYKAIREKTTYGFDPGYTPPGGVAGQQPWGAAFANLERIGFGDPYRDPAESVNYGFYEGTGNMFFPSLRMTGFFVERDMYLSLGNKYAGSDIDIQLVSPQGTTIDKFVQVSTQNAPTLTSVSPNAGSITGGTSVTLSGSLFLPGPPVGVPWVLFGNQLATNIVWVNATTITCTTPAIDGAGTVSVTVMNRDGQAVTRPSSFTYS